MGMLAAIGGVILAYVVVVILSALSGVGAFESPK
jgi:hypothetical protein